MLDKAQYAVWRKNINSKYANVDHLLAQLEISVSMSKTIIATGPGGFAKSEIIDSFCSTFFSNSYDVISCSSKTALTGLTNNLTEDVRSILEADFSRWKDPNGNWLSVIIFEEFFDLPLKTIQDMRTIIEQGWYIDPVTKVKTNIGVKLFIGLTNKTKEDVLLLASDQDRESMNAALQRYKRTINWTWQSYDQNSWLEFFTKFNMADNNIELLSQTFARICKPPVIISPRIAKNLALALDKNLNIDLELNIQTLSDLDDNLKSLLITEIKKTENILFNKEEIKKIQVQLKQKVGEIINSKCDSGLKVQRLSHILSKLNTFAGNAKVSADDRLLSTISDLSEQIKQNLNKLTNENNEAFKKLYKEELKSIESILKNLK